MSHYEANYNRWIKEPSLQRELKEEILSVTDEKEIEDRFYRYLEFGTAGLRGLIGAGTNRMNIYTIRRASYGFASYLLTQHKDAKERGIAIAYDSRHFSMEFAKETASLFASLGIKAYLFPQLRPTPMLSYAVRHLRAVGGIVITASHNPPTYNGYKVYNEEGCQISLEVADRILEQINKVDDELQLSGILFDVGLEHGLIELITDSLDQSYYQQVLSLSLNRDLIKNRNNDIKILYTPFHGAGNDPVRQVLYKLGFNNVHIVPEQTVPDPNFSTVTSPNPEDPQAFRLALAKAKRIDADVILGTDPDADRLGVVVKNSTNEYQLLNGNQLGSLLLYYILGQKNKHNLLPANGITFKTIVTSDIGRKISEHFNVKMEDTLTGFKFIGEKINYYNAASSYTFLFGYEESFGYLIGDFVRDKDAVQAAMLVAEMVVYYKIHGLTILEVLDEMYKQFGYYLEDQLSFSFTGKEGMDLMTKLMNDLRKAPLTNIAGIDVVKVKDYLRGTDSLPQADVLKFFLEDESWVAFRPSGTEPKLKCYISVVDKSKKAVEDKLDSIRNWIQTHSLLSN